MEDLQKYTAVNKPLQIIKINKAGMKEHYNSTFCKTGEDYYLISTPKIGNETGVLRKGENINLYLYTSEGIYNLKCSVLECYEKYYKISFPKNIQRAQRREFIRVNMRIPMQVVVEGNSGTRFYEIVTSNISARGVGFDVNGKITQLEKISVKFTLKGRIITTYAELVYCKERKFKTGPRYSVALNFTSVSQTDIDFIVKECFAFQAKARRQILNNEV